MPFEISDQTIEKLRDAGDDADAVVEALQLSSEELAQLEPLLANEERGEFGALQKALKRRRLTLAMAVNDDRGDSAVGASVSEDPGSGHSRRPAETPLHLLLVSPDSFITLPLPKQGTLSVGRSSYSDVQIDDAMVSRSHARLYCDDHLYLEDLGSQNGTFVKGVRITKGTPVRIEMGESIAVGSTTLIVQPDSSGMGRQRLWSHDYFESRLEEECQYAAASRGTFAVARLHLDRPVERTMLVPLLALHVASPHVVGAYAPDEYEFIFFRKTPRDLELVLGQLCAGLGASGVAARTAVSWFPEDGRSSEGLVARLNHRLRPRNGTVQDLASGMMGEGDDVRMVRLRDLARRVASSEVNVVVMGERGLQKEDLARFIHRRSPRADKPFVLFGCGGLPEKVEESLFGFTGDSFSHSGQPVAGVFGTATGGTLFLYDVEELSLSAQANLLRAIEPRAAFDSRGVEASSLNVRVIAATDDCDLEEEVMNGRFRRDLFFRLAGFSLEMPPLRERRLEIGTTARALVAQIAFERGREAPEIRGDVIGILEDYWWPGNVQELENYLDRAVAVSGNEIRPEHLPLIKMDQAHRLALGPGASLGQPPPEEPLLLERRRDERQRMLDALAAWGGNQTRAAESMGMPRRTFVGKLDRYGFPRPRKRETPASSLPAIEPPSHGARTGPGIVVSISSPGDTDNDKGGHRD
jgi:two-component system response regulator AtoC